MIKKTKGIETKKRYNEIKSYISTLAKDIENNFDEELSIDSFLTQEIETIEKVLSKETKKKISVPSFEKIKTSALFSPYEETRVFSSLKKNVSEQFYSVWDSAVRTGFLTGMTTHEVVKNVVGSKSAMAEVENFGTINSLRKSVYANVRTALQSFATESRNEIYKQNEELFDGYKWLGTLDRRTCLVCGNLDGKVFKSLKDIKTMPPFHFNCRCMIVPYFKDGVDTTRASENGQVDSKVTYKEWLETQPEEVQKEILGNTRYSMYQQGKEIGTFVSNGKIIPVLRPMANGQRRSVFLDLTEKEKDFIIEQAKELKIASKHFEFRQGKPTVYDDENDIIFIGSDIMPSTDKNANNRDSMTVKAVLAHEFYGHRQFRNTSLPPQNPIDEFRASYYAAVHAPSLSKEERQSLMRDAIDRANAGGIKLSYNNVMREILYGFNT